MKGARAASTLVLLALHGGVFSSPAGAIPAFARKYRTSCATCHVAFPVLNAFGRAFRARGYRMPGVDAQIVKDEPVSIGAPAWKKVFPKGLWPSDIPGSSVVSIWLSSQFKISPKAQINNEFDGLDELYLLGGGTFGESLSFFVAGEIVDDGLLQHDLGDARAFLQYNHPKHHFNLTVGLFEPRAVLASNQLRLMRISDYLSNVYGMPPTGNSFSLGPNQRGIEGWGNFEGPHGSGGLEWFAGVVNGRDSGTPIGADAFGPAVADLNERLQATLNTAGRSNWENNSNKDLYFGANYKLGGLGVLGTSVLPGDSTRPFAERSVTAGGFYYRGVAPALVTRSGIETFERDGNTFYRTGAKLQATIGDGDILAGVQWNRDHVRMQERHFSEVITLLESRYSVYPWLIPALRFENVNPNFGPSFYRLTPHVSVLVRANVRVSIEGVVSRNSETDPRFDFRRFDPANESRMQFRLDFAF